MRFILTGEVAQNRRWRWEMVPGIGYCFGCFWRVLRNKSPCGGRGGGEIGYYGGEIGFICEIYFNFTYNLLDNSMCLHHIFAF